MKRLRQEIKERREGKMEERKGRKDGREEEEEERKGALTCLLLLLPHL